MFNWSLDPRKWFIKKEKKPNGIVGIAFHEQGVALCHVIREEGDLKVIKLDFAPISAAEQQVYVKGWVARNKLKNADCYCVLNKDEYELELVESPNVEEYELPEAVRWRVKDLIHIPIEDAVIDIFHLPDDAYRGRMKMLYVVAANKQVIEDKIHFIKACGLDLRVIDIEELALRNLSRYIPQTEQGTVAFISMQEDSGQIHMFCHDDMYLTRSIEIGYSSFSPTETHELQIVHQDHENMMERFILDVQRSLDYYESQVGKGITNQVYILPTGMDHHDIKDSLQEAIPQNVIDFDCRKIVHFSEDLAPDLNLQAMCMTAIGAALRGNEYAAS